ncbi:hypothetical protein [Streptomyces cyaneofuscatus]|uniref:hypothetical protein n=1 Tax=Streptomyces cyaneofuscatus TaxID=66883 RepID=UPI0033ADE0EE
MTPVRGGAYVVQAQHRVRLLARNRAGWARLCRIVSAAHASSVDGVPTVLWPVLEEYAGGGDLVVVLGPPSEPAEGFEVRQRGPDGPPFVEQLEESRVDGGGTAHCRCGAEVVRHFPHST